MLALARFHRFALMATLLMAAMAMPMSVRSQTPAFDPANFSLNLELVIDGLERPVQMVDAGRWWAER